MSEQKHLALNQINQQISSFVKELFIQDVSVSEKSVLCVLEANKKDWLMNDHFPGMSLIQCFIQGAMLLYCENNKLFNQEKDLFFLGDLKVKFRAPVFINNVVKFRICSLTYTSGVLLFNGEGTLEDSNKLCVKIRGSLSSKSRSSL